MFTDSHCHLEDDETVLRAYKANVTHILNAGKDVDEITAQIEMCQRFNAQYAKDKSAPQMWTSAGVHPDSAVMKLTNVTVTELKKAAEHPEVIAIGECGLDYHYGAQTIIDQQEMFIKHIIAAGETGLPIMIHNREAEDDMIKLLMLGKEKFPNLTGVIHCFTSTKEFADELNKLGFYISASGIITFKNTEELADVFKTYPKDKILIETDSPYLSPVPYRGKTNEPAHIVKTAEKLAEILGLTVEEIARITTNNFFNLYQKAKR